MSTIPKRNDLELGNSLIQFKFKFQIYMNQNIWIENSNSGIVLKIVLDSENEIETRYLKKGNREKRYSILSGLCNEVQNTPNNFHITICQTRNFFTVRLHNLYVTAILKRIPKQRNNRYLEKYLISGYMNIEFVFEKGRFIVNALMNYKSFILDRNTELLKSIIQEALHPRRISKWNDIEDMFLI